VSECDGSRGGGGEPTIHGNSVKGRDSARDMKITTL
jgi:hypothetical protein